MELAILAALVGSPLHGYAIPDEVKRLTRGQIVVSLNGLYTTLQRMENKGLIASRWADEPNAAARRKYYRATKAGRAVASSTLAMLDKALKAKP